MKLRRCKTRDQSFLQLLKKNTSKIVIEILEKFTVEERFITWHFFGIPYFVSTKKKCRQFFFYSQNKQKVLKHLKFEFSAFALQIKTKDLGFFWVENKMKMASQRYQNHRFQSFWKVCHPRIRHALDQKW